MYSPRLLEHLPHADGPLWIYHRSEWRMASIIRNNGQPLKVAMAPDLQTVDWETCKSLPAISIATARQR